MSQRETVEVLSVALKRIEDYQYRSERMGAGMKLYLIEESDLESMRNIAKRLYTENRMDGDLMRDFAHRLSLIVRTAVECPEEG